MDAVTNPNHFLKKQQRSHLRTYGKGSRACRITGCKQGLIRKYNLNLSRRCFREQAELIGFHKVRHSPLRALPFPQTFALALVRGEKDGVIAIL